MKDKIKQCKELQLINDRSESKKRTRIFPFQYRPFLSSAGIVAKAVFSLEHGMTVEK
jgi:hypothetical protein